MAHLGLFSLWSKPTDLVRNSYWSSSHGLDAYQHPSAGEDHLLALGYRLLHFLPLAGTHSVNGPMDGLAGSAVLYVLSLFPRNKGGSLVNVAKHAQWKLNCFLQKQLCNNQFAHQDPFMGHPEDNWDEAPLLRGIRACCCVRVGSATTVSAIFFFH